MSQSLFTFQQQIKETYLKEIGELVIPYPIKIKFINNTATFIDDKSNTIKTIFHTINKEHKEYEVEFTVNDMSIESFKTEARHLFKILSTVISIIEKFIKKYKPYRLRFEGDDKTGKFGQKNKIWYQYAKVNLKDNNYTLSKLGKEGFAITINKNAK